MFIKILSVHVSCRQMKNHVACQTAVETLGISTQPRDHNIKVAAEE